MVAWCLGALFIAFNYLLRVTSEAGITRDISEVGRLDGPLYQLGDFDECVFEQDRKYCLSRVEILEGDGASPFWNYIQAYNADKTKFHRNLLHQSICVARNVTPLEAKQTWIHAVEPSAKSLGVKVRVHLPDCVTADKKPWTVGDVILLLVTSCIISLVCISTVWEYIIGNQDTNQGPMQPNTGLRCMGCFSLIRSWKNLKDTSNDNKDLHCMQGIRTITMILFINGHNFLQVLRGPIKHVERFEQTYSKLMQMVMLNGHIMLAFIFSISGFMAYYNFAKDVRKHETFKWSIVGNSVINRYLRLTPAYAVVLLFAVSFMDKISTGPTWPMVVEAGQDNCKTLWWINLLYLNNYIGVDHTCLIHTWYLATDFQLYCFCLLMLALITIFPRITNLVFGLGMVVGVLIPFIQTYLNEAINPVLLVFPETMRHITEDLTYQTTYISSQGNFGVYMVGIVTGYIYTKVKRSNIQINKVILGMLWIAPFILSGLSILSVYWYYQPQYTYGRLEAAAMSGLNRVVYSVGFSSAILLGSLGHGGVCNSLLIWKPFIIFGRLGYCVYLVHFVLQMIEVGITRVPVDLGAYQLLCRSMADTVMSFSLALLLHLLVELPFSALRRQFLSGDTKRGAQTQGVCVENHEITLGGRIGPWLVDTESRK